MNNDEKISAEELLRVSSQRGEKTAYDLGYGVVEKRDPVNHPSHYETGKFECIDVMMEALGEEAVLKFCLCNAFKYIYRATRKNGVEDIKKAQWYINRYLKIIDDMQSEPAACCIK